jgi:hypothetical protein
MPQAFATVGPGDGPDLSRWPLLAWFPDAGVVTEDHQIPVQQIGDLANALSPEEIAEQFGTTIKHVNQALDYIING